MEQGLKIISLTAENVKKLVAVEIVPKGNFVEIAGKNGSGKTSVLDAISWAFEGMAKVQDRPIRYGANKAWIRIDLGQYIIERTFKTTEKGELTSLLTVMSADGAKFDSPQTLLNTLFGELSFDPLAFSRADSKGQVAMLESLVKGFDFAKSREDEKMAYDDRTAVNRRAKESSLLHVSFKDVPVAEPEKVDVAVLTQEMTDAARKNAEREKQIAAHNIKIKDLQLSEASLKKSIGERIDRNTSMLVKIQELSNQIEDLKSQIKANSEQVDVDDKNLILVSSNIKTTMDEPQPAIVDITSIKTSLDSATAKNDIHEKWLKKKRAKDDVEALEKESQALTDKIESIKKTRYDAVANAGLPVTGLGFDETGVTLNGVPFAQGSDAEQLRASVALAMAANPTLRVIRVRDGSLLDEDGMKLLAEMAEKTNCQVWCERVGVGTVGFELVDGSLKQ